ncbi:AhpC/TSA family protein [Rubripirellula tenax]|uniref:AhpC/TSA family protein n=1 Tax=Rubripirellula tenax TaxID=2528015 RepID=A0A5C6FHB9_9BACT|nr:redoxin domain-containing protein [Rubripirellula tenax]TWU60265.1 AhpC/TSA family protein [Rubripirellula tenax]
MSSTRLGLLFMVACVVFSGCRPAVNDGITFSDVVQSQTQPIEDFSELAFTGTDGRPVKLVEGMKRKYTVLVVTRGWTGAICLYCASQTSKWARRFDELEQYDAELVVVFPTETDGDVKLVEELRKKITGGPVENESIPFPIFLDIDLQSVDQLGIRDELAKPATYIVDRQGRVRFAYVGQSIADRPSVDAILKQLERMSD